MRRVVVICVAAVVAVGVLSAQQAPAHRFGLDDFSSVARVADPQIAPDGKSIAVVISHQNLDEDRYDPELDVIDVATSASKTLVSGQIALTSPRWAPNGQQLAFLANAGTGSAAHLQVFVVSAKGGQPKALTIAPRPVQQIAWSPDSKTIAYATQDEPEKKAGFERFNDSFEVTLNTDFTMTAAVPPTHVWIVSASGGDAKRLTSGTWSLPISHPPGPPASAIVWTPDGSAIAFSRTGGGGGGGGGAPAPAAGAPVGRGQFDPVTGQLAPAAPARGTAPAGATPAGAGAQGAGARTGGAAPPGAQRGGGGGGIQLVNISDGSIKPLGNVNGTFPQFAPAGDAVAFMGNGGVSFVPAPGGQPKNLTAAIDRNMARALWMPDAKSLLVGANDSTRVSLWLQPLDGPAKKLDIGDLSPNSSFYVDMNVGKDGAIAFSASSATRPAELYYMASANAPVKRLTDVNGAAAALPLGKTEVIEWKNDNFEENGLLTYPLDFDPSQKYPLVLVIHGGPKAASLLNFSAQAQLMAAKGWLVFQPNYRGSDNLGNAYANAIRNDAGEGPGRDVIAGIDAVKKKVNVDETRMAVSGWSYGGYMTTWMLGHYDIWKAAVTGASVTNELDQYNLSDSAGGGRGNNSPWVSPQAMDRMRAQSPITYASKMKAPTLILHDVGDFRVTITQSYELFHALKDNGVTTQFFAYPISGHSPADPVRQRDVQRRWVGWLEQYLNAPAKTGGGQ